MVFDLDTNKKAVDLKINSFCFIVITTHPCM